MSYDMPRPTDAELDALIDEVLAEAPLVARRGCVPAFPLSGVQRAAQRDGSRSRRGCLLKGTPVPSMNGIERTATPG